MPTHDYVIDNGTGAAVRDDINNALAAIVSNNSNTSAPSTLYAYQWWADTGNNVMKLRNSANNDWHELFQLDGTIILEDGSASTPELTFRDDPNTGIFSSAADTLDISCGGTARGSFSSSGLAVTGNVTATTFVGNIDAVDGDFDGTLEADAITIGGVALNEFISDTVGAMVSSNTETGITVTYQDSDNTLDFVIGTLNQDTTGTAAIATTVTTADESSDTSCFPLFVTAATGNLAPKTGSNLAFNAQTGVMNVNGILFGSDTAAANTLDDYEEGTFTPVYRGSSSAGSYSPATAVGIYRKVGSLVYASVSLLNISGSGGSGDLQISGFPFVNNASQSSLGNIFLDDFNMADTAVHLVAIIGSGNDFATIREVKDTDEDTTMAVGDLDGSNSDLILTITYTAT